jgi:hypothetical protein
MQKYLSELPPKLIEEKWRLKSQSMWLQYGDKSTSFFHKKTKERRFMKEGFKNK